MNGIISVCSGYGGLDMAVAEVFGEPVTAFIEYDEAPSRILAHRWPAVPNLGDLTTVDWVSLERPRIICGGTPCQDLSGAGKRAGMVDGSRSNLWVAMREGVAILRPEYVIWENVRGAYSAYAVSEVESEPGLLGRYSPVRPALRGLGRVLGDLSSLGYDTSWVGVRASDVGAPHGRYRVFVLATNTQGNSGRFGNRNEGAAENTNVTVGDQRRQSAPGQTEGGRARPNLGGRSGTLATHTHDSGRSEHGGGIPVREEQPPAEHPSDDIAWGDPAAANTRSERLGEHPGESSAEETGPRNSDLADGSGGSRTATDWGPYLPAIRRWESVLGRTAPAPTKGDGKNGQHRLSAQFVEWMMGLDPGHVTDPAIGLTRNQQLKALGNGVVPQQAAMALRMLLGAE